MGLFTAETHMHNMAGDSSKPPAVMWAQRTDKVYLTINIEDAKDTSIELLADRLVFSAKGGVNDQKYEVTLEFFGELDAENSKYLVQSRNIPMVLVKKEEKYWDRLLKEKTKRHFVKTDFDKWRDGDDSDFEEGNDMQLEDMMKQMGNFNGADAGGYPEGDEEEEDSDDEGLPDLE